MDNLNHLVTMYGAIVIMGIYPFKKSMYLLAGMFVLTFFNYWLALQGSMSYNNIGWAVCYGLFVYTIIERLRATDVKEQVNLEKVFALMVGNIAAALSHGADDFLLAVDMTDKATLAAHKRDLFRPHNFWHTPFFAVFSAVIAMTTIFYFFEWYSKKTEEGILRFRTPLKYLILSYIIAFYLHILGDTGTYDYPIFWFWPFNSMNFSLYSLINNGLVVSCPPGNPDCFVYFYAMPWMAWIFVSLAILTKLASHFAVRSSNNFPKLVNE